MSDPVQVMREVSDALGDARLLMQMGMPAHVPGILRDAQHAIREYLDTIEVSPGQTTLDEAR